jgi:hypothetical protein
VEDLLPPPNGDEPAAVEEVEGIPKAEDLRFVPDGIFAVEEVDGFAVLPPRGVCVSRSSCAKLDCVAVELPAPAAVFEDGVEVFEGGPLLGDATTVDGVGGGEDFIDCC